MFVRIEQSEAEKLAFERHAGKSIGFQYTEPNERGSAPATTEPALPRRLTSFDDADVRFFAGDSGKGTP